MVRYNIRVAVVFALYLFLSLAPGRADDHTVSQFSTIDALLAGYYEGVVSLEEALKYGNFGLGTVDQLNGELIVLEGVCYQVRADGTVNRLSTDTMTPWAMVTSMRPQLTVSVTDARTLTQLQAQLDTHFPLKYIYAFRLDGKFEYMKVRSVPRQTRPFRPLGEVVKEQSVFEFTELSGTVVGFRTPEYLKAVGVPGYHMHFLSTDKKVGGHVLELRLKDAKLSWQSCNSFLLKIPEKADFHRLDLDKDRAEELDRVER